MELIGIRFAFNPYKICRQVIFVTEFLNKILKEYK